MSVGIGFAFNLAVAACFDRAFPFSTLPPRAFERDAIFFAATRWSS
jgi:hypothetical protein